LGITAKRLPQALKKPALVSEFFSILFSRMPSASATIGTQKAAKQFSAVANKLGIRGRCVFGGGLMGHCKGKDNVKKRAARRKKTDRLALAKSLAAPAAAK